MFSWKLWYTCESVCVRVSWDSLSDGGVEVTVGSGLDEVTSDGFHLGAPSQCERSILHVRDPHTPWRTYICIEDEIKQ